MIPAPADAPGEAFIDPDAGVDYFATDAHHQSLASRLLSALRSGRNLALVVKEGPAEFETLVKALNRSPAARYGAVGVACRAEMDLTELLRSLPTLTPAADAGAPVPLRQPPPLLVLDNADRLSYEQIEQIYDALQGSGAVAVLLTNAEFLSRLERPALRFLREALAAQIPFQQLGREEVGAFILHQLRSPGDMNAFPAETVAAIADVSGGEPAAVNRLARLVAEFAVAGETPPPLPPTPTKPSETRSLKLLERRRQRGLAEPAPADALKPSPPTLAEAFGKEAFGKIGAGREPIAAEAAETPPPLPAPARRRSILRVPVGIMVAVTYVAVVGAASIGVFWLLHPAAKNFVSSGTRDISVALDLLREKIAGVEAPKASAPPAATTAPAVADRKAPTSPATPVTATDTAANLATPTPVAAANNLPAGSPSETAAAPTPPAPPEALAATPSPEALPAPAPPSVPASSLAVAGGHSPDQAVAPMPAPAAADERPAGLTTETQLPASEAAPVPAAPAVAMPTAATPAPETSASATATSATVAKTPEAAADTASAAATPAPASAPAPATATVSVAALNPPAATPPAVAPAPAPAIAGLSTAEITDLMDRGDALVRQGDIISARLYYERAADAGNGRAALLVGQTYDPAYLHRIGVLGVPGNPILAANWYRRAHDLGDASAAGRLKALAAPMK